MFKRGLRAILFLLLCSVALPGDLAFAQEPQDKPAPAGDQKPAAAEGDTEALAKAAQNPVASLISVPLQNNTAFGVGAYDRTQNVLNIQPVIPVTISENWNVIVRIIQPIVWQPDVSQNSQGWFGFGDMNPTFFFSPAKPHKLIWGQAREGRRERLPHNRAWSSLPTPTSSTSAKDKANRSSCCPLGVSRLVIWTHCRKTWLMLGIG